MNTNILIPAIGAAILAIIAGPIFIPWLHNLNAEQSIREDGPKSHLKKGGTPTIGGIIFLTAVIIAVIVFKVFDKNIIIIMLSTYLFALIGFIDDYIKVVKKRNLGLTAKQKLAFQLLASVIVIVFQYRLAPLPTNIFIPFIKRYIDLGFLYIPFIIFVIIGTTNSTNLTDGLDGLSSGVTIITMIFLTIMAKAVNEIQVARFAAVFAGALLGFLFYNKYPAKVFMGDTGSLALGGAVCGIAICLKYPLILPILGGVYFLETLSVIIQVVVFKKTGKRVFLMSPLHHHFEGKGWSEKKVVHVFYCAAIVFGLLGYLMVK